MQLTCPIYFPLHWPQRESLWYIWPFNLWTKFWVSMQSFPDSKVHGANMGPIWVLSAPCRPHEPCHQGYFLEENLLFIMVPLELGKVHNCGNLQKAFSLLKTGWGLPSSRYEYGATVVSPWDTCPSRKPFSQWKHSFQMKAVLSLAEWLVTALCHICNTLTWINFNPDTDK